jgi:hypothetical protein
MYCPKCRSEYREGFTRCNDCDEPLVEKLSEEPPQESHEDDFVDILETSDKSLVPVIKSVLEGAGIPYFIQNEEALDLFEGMMDYRNLHATVFVPKEMAEEAKQLLESDAGFAADDEEDADDQGDGEEGDDTI